MADFIRAKFENPKMKQSEMENQLGLSPSTLQRYRSDIDMLSPYGIQSNNTKRIEKTKNTNFNNNSHREHDVKRPQMNSNDLKSIQTKSNKKNKKNSERRIGA